jgi:hypothetical protein
MDESIGLDESAENEAVEKEVVEEPSQVRAELTETTMLNEFVGPDGIVVEDAVVLQVEKAVAAEELNLSEERCIEVAGRFPFFLNMKNKKDAVIDHAEI